MNRFIACIAASLVLGSATAAPLRDPVAGPLEVLAQAGAPARQGEFAGVALGFTNTSAEHGVQVHVDEVSVRWSDGSTFDVGMPERRILLPPGGAQLYFLALVVPADAPLGDATLTVRAHASRVTRSEDVGTDPSFPEYRLYGGAGHRTFPGDSHATDTAGFTVVP